MNTLFLLYGIIVFMLFIGGFFILYHILRYSLTSSLGYFGAVLFGSVFLILLSINFASFQSLQDEIIIPSLTLSPLEDTPTPRILPSQNNPW